MPIRKLVTIRKVLDLIPIEGADRIELAKVDGWKCVVKKNVFNVGDYGVYFEVDSFLPENDIRYEFLKKGSLRKMLIEGKGYTEGIRIRTVRLMGIESHGLLLPLKDFPELNLDTDINVDLSKKLGVIKFEQDIPAELSGDARGCIPSIIKRTDQERVQNLVDYFDLYKDLEFEETEKEDGTSTTYYYLDSHVGVCGHNWEFYENYNNIMWKNAQRYGIISTMPTLNKNVAIQGETVGEGIQKNKMVLKGQYFHVFDIYDIEKYRYMTPSERYEYINIYNYNNIFAEKLTHVPILKKNVKIFSICKNVEEIIEYSRGDTQYCKGKPREGLVFKSTELVDGRVITFKVRVLED